MQWEDVPEVMDAWVLRVAAPAWDLKRAAADAWTAGDVGYYLDPDTDQVALYGQGATRTDLALCKAAAARALGICAARPVVLTEAALADPETQWVKIAYSPTIRRLGELLNFFPGQYPGGIPNAPSPLAATLTSGVVGAGLGYGLGRLGEAILPERYGKKLRRTGAIIGGLAGAAPGAIWGAINLANKKPLTSGWPLNTRADALPAPETSATWPYGNEMSPHLSQSGAVLGGTAAAIPGAVGASGVMPTRHLDPTEKARGTPASYKTLSGMDAVELPDWWRRCAAKTAAYYDTFDPGHSPVSVNVNAMGQLLWDTGASPQLTATTMGTLYAARQLPDPYAHPGVVTGHQLGQLAMNAAGDYVTGLLVGKALNLAVGTPYSARSYGLGNAALGVIGSVMPRLLGG